MKQILTAIITVLSIHAFAGDADSINWNCTQTSGFDVTTVSIKNGQATVRSFDRRTKMMPIIVGGPYGDLQTFGGGDFIGVRSAQDDSFSLIAGSLNYKSNFGGIVHLDNVVCK